MYYQGYQAVENYTSLDDKKKKEIEMPDMQSNTFSGSSQSYKIPKPSGYKYLYVSIPDFNGNSVHIKIDLLYSTTIWIIVGAVVGLGSIIGLIIYFASFRKEKEENNDNKQNETNNDNSKVDNPENKYNSLKEEKNYMIELGEQPMTDNH